MCYSLWDEDWRSGIESMLFIVELYLDFSSKVLRIVWVRAHINQDFVKWVWMKLGNRVGVRNLCSPANVNKYRAVFSKLRVHIYQVGVSETSDVTRSMMGKLDKLGFPDDIFSIFCLRHLIRPPSLEIIHWIEYKLTILYSVDYKTLCFCRL